MNVSGTTPFLWIPPLFSGLDAAFIALAKQRQDGYTVFQR